MDFDEHLSALERGDFYLVDHQRLALLDQYGGGCFHDELLTTDNTDFTDGLEPPSGSSHRTTLFHIRLDDLKLRSRASRRLVIAR